MAIKNIQVKGKFTVFSDFEINFNRGINLLIGANGVGKTQLLKLMYVSAVSQKHHLEANMVSERIKMGIPADIVQSSISAIFDVDIEYMQENYADTRISSGFDGLYFPQVTFIPAAEMLSHAKGLPSMKKKYGANMPFDVTLLDIIEKAQAWKLEKLPELAKEIIPPLEKIMEGIVEVKDDGSFWMKKNNGDIIPFSLEAEGLKKIGLLWQLLVNESITSDSVILWDEPEASINPGIIPVLVEVILKLQRAGVQIIAATHSYNFARYFDILRNNDDAINYYSLFRADDGVTQYSQSDKFISIQPNLIDDAGERLYNDAIARALEEI